MDEENLKRKLKNLHQNEMDLAFIFIILLYALIEEDIKSPNDIYSLILQHNRHNKLITYIIRLIQAYENKEIGYDFLESILHILNALQWLYIFLLVITTIHKKL